MQVSDGQKTGSRMERFAEELIAQAGYEYIHPSRFFDEFEVDIPAYTRQCKAGTDIYEKNRRVDILLYHPVKWRDMLIIQCKWQASSGSTEQKFPFEVASINHNPWPTIILLDGGGYTDGAEKWIRAQAGAGMLERVVNMGEFQRLVSRGLI